MEKRLVVARGVCVCVEGVENRTKVTEKEQSKWKILPAITALGIYPVDLKTYFRIKTCTQMLLSCFIHNHLKEEATKTSFSKWMDK